MPPAAKLVFVLSAAEMLAVKTGPVYLSHVALRPPDREMFAIENLAAYLHTAVGVVADEPNLELQFEVAVFPLAAQKRVEFEPLRRCPIR